MNDREPIEPRSEYLESWLAQERRLEPADASRREQVLSVVRNRADFDSMIDAPIGTRVSNSLIRWIAPCMLLIGAFVAGRLTAPSESGPKPRAADNMHTSSAIADQNRPTSRGDFVPPPNEGAVVTPEPVHAKRAIVERSSELPTPERGGSEAPRNSLERERELLDVARAALLRRNHQGAFVAIRTHRQRFADGVLQEDMSALEVQALVLAGQTDAARHAAVAFHQRYPNSLFKGAVASAIRSIPEQSDTSR